MYLGPRSYMTTHQQDSSQPQQPHSSPQPMVVGLGLMMDLMLEAALPGILEGGWVFLVESRVREGWLSEGRTAEGRRSRES